ncbi:MAG: HAD hydrolase-like protein [Thermodesulfobacteriota bacterium]
MANSLFSCHSNILFDLDGTLSDPRQGIFNCFNRTLASLKRGPASHDELTACIGPPLEASFSQLLDTTDVKKVAGAVDAFRACYGKGGLFENILYPGVSLFLKSLHQGGWQLFVATAKKEEFARKILRHFQIDSFFTDIIGAGGRQSGDKGNLIAEIIQRHTLSAAETIMIGDRSHDIVGARANKIQSYGVLWGFGSHKELEEAGATKTFVTLNELQEFLLAPNA